MIPEEIVEQNLARYPCFGKDMPYGITLSWSRLSSWHQCKRRIRLTFEGKKQKFVNARNFLTGNLVDYTMREALTYYAQRDSEGRLIALSKDDFMSPLPDKWNLIINNPEKNTVYDWKGDMQEDQRRILLKATEALDRLYPIVIDNIMGRRFIPEFRPQTMPAIGIPGLDGETVYIRLFLAVDMAIQVEEDPTNPNGGLGKWGLFDLKTTETEDYLTKTLPQLVFYDLAFHAATGSYPSQHALWAPLVDEPIKKVTVTDEHRRQVRDWIISYCHSVWASEDDLTDDPTNCYNCPTKLACPKFVHPVTRDEQGITRVSFGAKGDGMLQLPKPQ